MGLEPIWISPFDFKSNAYTNSAIRASLRSARRVPRGERASFLNSSIKSRCFGFSQSEARLLTERARKNSKEPILARILEAPPWPLGPNGESENRRFLEAPTGIEPVYKVLQTSA